MRNTHRATAHAAPSPSDAPRARLRFLGLVAAALAGAATHAAEPAPLYLRNANPLQQTLGAPAMQGGELTAAGALASRAVLNVANHADYGLNGEEAVFDGEEAVFDGESYYLELVLRYGLRPGLEVGVDLPLVSHSGGIFDSLITEWHDLIGLSNEDRSGPRDSLHLSYRRNGVTEYDVDEPTAGLGDIRLAAAWQIASDAGRALALRAQAELPTGDADRLRGNGAVDLSLVVDGTDRLSLAAAGISLFARVGVVAPGSGDLLQDLQEDWVLLAGAGLAWEASERWALQAQIDYDGSYFDSSLDELGSSTRFSFGGSYCFDASGPRLSAALIQNLFSDATPDFGLYLALTLGR